MKGIKLNDLLTIRQENELWFINNERSVFVSTRAFGALQKDLIENIGINRLKAFSLSMVFNWEWKMPKIS